ncbi:MAG: WG repeat-containing protein, partial [Xanthomarina sp.]
ASVYTKEGTGYINKKGEFVIAPIYNNTLSFKNGLAEVETAHEKFLINKEGKKIIQLDSEQIIMGISE